MSLDVNLSSLNDVVQPLKDLGSEFHQATDDAGNVVDAITQTATDAAETAVSAVGEALHEIGILIQELIDALKNYAQEAIDSFNDLMDKFSALKEKCNALMLIYRKYKAEGLTIADLNSLQASYAYPLRDAFLTCYSALKNVIAALNDVINKFPDLNLREEILNVDSNYSIWLTIN